MRILLAPDKFKGTLNAPAVVEALASRLEKSAERPTLLRCPLADGGEGTLDAVLPASGPHPTHRTLDARLRPTVAPYGILPSEPTRDILLESAACLGLSHLPRPLRNPEQATSFGLGSLLHHALRHHPRRALLALGGVATVEGGVGFLQALGARFLTAGGTLPSFAGGATLGQIVSADLEPVHALLKRTRLEAWCDVLSPLSGEKGAARMFAPQKGASPEAVARLDQGLLSFVQVLEQETRQPLRDLPGAGAAGGLGLAIAALGGDLRSGAAAVAEAVGLEEKMRSCDLVLTGEGRLDASTRQGKAPWGVLEMARRLGKPCVAVAGCATDTSGGWSGVISLFPGRVEMDDPRLRDLGPAWDEAVAKLAPFLRP